MQYWVYFIYNINSNMSNKDDIDYDVGSYRCEGSIEHFKFR